MTSLTNFSKQGKSLIIALVGVIGISSCSRQQEAALPAAGGTPVRVTSPRIMDMVESMDLNANTVFLKKEIVRATFQGFLSHVEKNIGDEIKAGDLLFRIKTKESVASDSQLQVLGTGAFQGSVDVRAKSNGILTTLNYNAGDFVSDGEEIAVISNPSSLCITLNIPYGYVSRINRHSPCTVFLPDGKTLEAAIDRIIPSVDPIAQTQTFLLQPNRPIDLPENLNVNARLPLRTVKNALVLPLRAIMSDETQENFWIMRLVDDSTAVRIDIAMGIENDTLVQVIHPALDTTDRIVTDGAYGLPDTAHVTRNR